MRPDAVEAINNWEKYHADMGRKHRRFGVAIVLTAVFLLALGVAVTK